MAVNLIQSETPSHRGMVRLEVPLVGESGRIIGWGDRWQTHRVRTSADGIVLGEKHVGITIALLDGRGRILVAHRRHKIFDQVWTLSGDTHPYRYGLGDAENLSQAAKRCAKDDLGVVTEGWVTKITVSYASRDPRDPRYCENELLRVMVTRYDGPLRVNERNAYAAEWVESSEIDEESKADLKKEPIERKYAPWVHAIFTLPQGTAKRALV